jgi:tetratricopeptide (TPR) repeat protein
MAGLRRSALWLAVVGIGLVAATNSRAANQEWPVKRGPSHEPVPYKYDHAAWKNVPHQFLDDYVACTLYSATNYLIEPDGTVETIVHEVTRLNGRKGIDKLGEYKNISFDPAYEQLVLNEARVIKANGTIEPIEPRHAQLRDISTDYQVYDHEKQLIISFPDLEVGDTIEVKWTVRGKNPEFAGQFFGHYTFGDDHYPVVQDHVLVRAPKAVDLKYATVGGKLDPEIQRDADKSTYLWKTTNRSPLPQDDDIPPKDTLRLEVSFSTFSSWDEVAKWKKELRKDCWVCDQELSKLVKNITKDLKTPLEKARALTLWVRQNIRYVSVGETHAYTPLTPATVLAGRYGDCKDQSQMLAVMLREAGVPVSLVTLGTRGDGQVLEDVPSPWGTHAILLVTIDGVDHWVDTTVSLAGWDFLPRDDRDRSCYLFDDKGIRMSRTPPMTARDHRTEQVTRVTVRPDGSSLCERTVTYSGGAALSQRDTWVEVPPGERRRLMTAELQDANSKTRLVELAVDEKKLMTFDDPVTARMKFEIPGHFTGDPTREGSVTDSKVWSRLLSYNLDYDRTVPLELWSPFESHHHYIVHLPPMYRLDSPPEDFSTSSKWGTFKVKVTAKTDEPHKLELDFDTRIDETTVMPDDFDEFRKFHDDVNKHYRVWLELKESHDIKDAPALEIWQATNPADSTSAAALAEIYLHNDRKADARRVIDAALVRKPEEAELWELKVRAADTLADEEQCYRKLTELFPQEQKYLVSFGSILVQRARYDEAQKVLKQAASKGAPTLRAQALYYLAQSAFKQDQPAEALGHLEAAEEADAESTSKAPVLRFKAHLLEKVGKNAEAAATYREVLKQEADSTDALAALVRLLLPGKDRQETLTYLRRYTLAVGEDPEGLVQAAEFHLRLDRYEDAFDLAEQAAEKKFDGRSQAVMGLVYLQRGNTAKAIFHLERAPVEAAVAQGLLQSYIRADRLRDAEDLLPKIEKVEHPTARLLQTTLDVAELVKRRNDLLHDINPQEKFDLWRNAISHYVCAERGVVEGQPADKIEPMLNEVFSEGIDFGLARSLRGLLYLERGRLQAAFQDSDKAVSLNPKDARGYLVRGRVRLERAAAGALSDLEKAVQLTQNKDGVMLHWYAAALWQGNQAQKALAAQREAVKLRPDDKLIQEQLKMLGG